MTDARRPPVVPDAPASLTELVAAQARAHPERVAVVAGPQRLTYAHLVHRVRSLAGRLRHCGVGRDVPVPLLLERSLEMPIAVLAVLEAGGICVPLDASHPIARLEFVLDDCGADLLVTNVDADPRLRSGRRLVDLREEDSRSTGWLGWTPDGDGDRLVYCLYTSGSTGQPKGVLLKQRGVLNVLRWAQDYLAVRSEDAILYRTTFTFDISIVEQLLPLSAGARLVVLPAGAEWSPAAIRQTIVEHDVTIVQFTPSGLAAHLTALDHDPLPGVRRCLSAGEPLKLALRDAFYEATNGCQLYNLYGPTETTIYATASAVPRHGPVSVGIPLPNTRLEILDAQRRPCATGETGEVWIGGAGVAHGYLKRPELTLERFVEDPRAAGERAFRTGDLGLWLASGEVELRGRSDHQVKIRGYRIELGEVESALSSLDGVGDAVVIDADLNGRRELVAYWTGDTDVSSLLEGLRRTLPAYMVPARFLRLDAFPLTSTEKVDRAALPLPDLHAESACCMEASPDALDPGLCAILEEVLGWGRVGLNDRFLDLGGDSLKAVRVVLLVRQRLERVLEIDALLRNHSIGELLAQLVELPTEAPCALQPAPPAEWHPLSSGQRALWLLAQAGVSHAAYTEPLVYELIGPLDREALRRAVERLLSRHESLRTAIRELDGVPVQRPVDDATLEWHEEVVTDAADVERRLRDFVALDFDLSSGQLLRGLLVERSATDHILVLTMHHIATDGWSLTLLIDEVVSAYNACRGGAQPTTGSPRLQYKDYSHWQQQRLAAAPMQESRAYWQKRLQGDLDPLDLPTDRPRPATRTFGGGTIRRTLPIESLHGLTSLCREESTTLYVGISTVLRVLFHRYTGQEDFILGTSWVGRPVPGLEDQIGYYINPLALRDTVTAGMSFRQVLRVTHLTTLEALRHHEYPFDRLVGDLGLTTSVQRNPLFDVMIVVDPGWGDPTTTMDGLLLRRLEAPNAHSKIDLTLFFKETATGLGAAVEYSTDIFDADRIERLLDHVETLLTAAAAAPDDDVASLAALPAEERRRVLHTFNDTLIAYDLDTPVHRLFERQVERVPDHPATVDEQRVLTFAELNSRANALAWTLRDQHGVGPGTLVAALMDRSVDLMVAILGILKAGGAYLPISTKDPDDRIRSVLEDSGSTLVVVDSSRAVELLGEEHMVVDLRRALTARTDNPPARETPGDPVYCIYTSGSTGRPNGVLVEHGALVNRLRWMIDDLGLDQSDVILQKTPYVFDVSVWELLLPGMIGAKQVMLGADGESDPATIHHAIEQHGVTVIHFVPSMLEQYLSAVHRGFRGVRHCISSGEALNGHLARRFLEAVGPASTQLWNYYGPTEATVDVTSARIDHDVERITIGRPASNNRIYILGEADQPCPIGVTGELCIGGRQVSRGYLNRPNLTAHRFTTDPFHAGGRMYHTGDLARWLPTGEILHLGRRDRQVKLRGFRIELGEIEHALCDVAGVDGAVVDLLRTDAGIDVLCAYVSGVACPPPQRLRSQLSQRLAGYMVPSRYVHVDSIPLTRNGKVDRQALVALAADLTATTSEHVPPRSQTEKDLLQIWNAMLPPGRIGVTDDFFLAGGNSLSALQLSSRITRRFGTSLGVASIFRYRTVAEQARLIEDSPSTPPASLPALRPHPRSSRHRLSFAQQRVWFLQMLHPESGAYNIRLLARLTGLLDVAALEHALQDLVARHEMLRTTFVSDDDGVFQIPRSDLPVAFQTRDLRGMPTHAARGTVRDETQRTGRRPFALQDEPPLRVVLFRVDPAEHHLLIVLHHLAGDAWSLRLMTQELSKLYRQRLGEPSAALAPSPLQYIDYVEWLRRPEYQHAIDEDVRYWLSRLGDCPSLELPTDVPAEGTPPHASGRTSVTVPPQTTRRLRDLAAATSTTPFEITMSALSLLLSRLSDQPDVVVGFPVANRQTLELEDVVGLFLNTLVLRTDLSGQPTFTELLLRVADGVRQAYSHQAAPFELVVERLNPVRHLDRAPIFDVLLNHLGDIHDDLAFPGVSVEYESHHFDVEAKFGLVFYVRDETDGMHIDLVHRTALFSAHRAETVVRQLRLLLEQVAETPEAPISSYSLLVPDGDTPGVDLAQPLDRPDHPPVSDLVAEHASASPDRIAIVSGADTITYGTLTQRVDSLARRLIGRGCGPGDVVAVTGPRSIGFVVGLLGALRCGATAIPIDPELPEGRRRHLLRIGNPTTLVRVGDDASPRREPSLPEVTAVLVDAPTGMAPAADADADADAEAVQLPPVATQSPAYLFFTSGTAHAPRGVLGWHGALSHFLLWQRQTFGITAEDRCAQTTSASFDVMLRDTLLPLVSGGTLVIPEPADEVGGRAVLRWLERQRITVLHAVPTVLQSWLLDAPTPSRLPDLRWLFLAGEPLKASLVDRFRSLFPDSGEIVNLYGPTETTLAKFAHLVPHGPLPPILPVGSPLPQCQAILVREGIRCGVGEPGEIVIRTPFRALGYLNDPEATAQAWYRNPHRDDGSDLLYRTGDIGRLRPDGLLEVLGRQDHQVKISGVRIQPAEIEGVLGQHPLVSACLVVAYRDRHDEPHLAAYVVAHRHDSTLGDRLRAHLSDRLPRAMVPGRYIVVDRIPTTPNGKPDRAALPDPLLAVDTPPAPVAAPRTDTQRGIGELWAEVLGRPLPGIHDNFFELGGTSLKLLRLYSLLEARHPGRFRVAQLFTHPTVAGQATLVEPTQAPSADEVLEHEL
jgi:amino acid adenylation domain-containing protein